MAHGYIGNIRRVRQPHIHRKARPFAARPVRDAVAGFAAMKDKAPIAPAIGGGGSFGRVQHHTLGGRRMHPKRGIAVADRAIAGHNAWRRLRYFKADRAAMAAPPDHAMAPATRWKTGRKCLPHSPAPPMYHRSGSGWRGRFYHCQGPIHCHGSSGLRHWPACPR